MRCDGERISGHGMDSTSTPFGLKETNTSLKSIVLVQEKLLCSIVLLFISHRQLLLYEWREEPDAFCQLNDTMVFLPNNPLPDNSDAEIVLNIIHFSQLPFPKSSQ